MQLKWVKIVTFMKSARKKASIKITQKNFSVRRGLFFRGTSRTCLKKFYWKSFTFSCTLFGSTTRKQKNFFCCNKYFWRDLFGTERKVSKFRRMFTGSLSPSLGFFPFFCHLLHVTTYFIIDFSSILLSLTQSLQYFEWWMWTDHCPEAHFDPETV